MTEETRYLIVGSGVAGGLVAEQLLARGSGSVTMLEAGPPIKMRDRRTWLDYVMAGRLPYDHLSDTASDYDVSGNQPWRIEGGRLIVRGGSTLHWGGWCPRMKPEDFHLATNTGKGGLDWPFTYKDLEPYYLQAEHYLQVAGDSDQQNPPRSGKYLFRAPPYTMVDGEMIDALHKMKVSYEHMPVARNGRPVNDLPNCMTTGTCYYCPIGGRFTGDQPLDRLSVQKRFTLKTGAAVTQLLADGKRITGVTYLDLETGKSHKIEADKVILCAGALETPKLMLVSKSSQWPEGVGNTHDLVGRYLIANPYFYARGAKDINRSYLQEETYFPTLCSRHWDGPEDQAKGKFILNRGESPDLKPAVLMSQGKTRKELDAMKIGPYVFEIQGALQTFSYKQNRITPGKGTTRFGLSRTQIDMPVDVLDTEHKATVHGRMSKVLETMGYRLLEGEVGLGVYPQRGDHAMSTCRMGKTPEQGVVDPDLKVFGTDNLYILSNAVFPSGAAANPTLTLAALAFRFMDHLLGRK